MCSGKIMCRCQKDLNSFLFSCKIAAAAGAKAVGGTRESAREQASERDLRESKPQCGGVALHVQNDPPARAPSRVPRVRGVALSSAGQAAGVKGWQIS